MGPQKLWDGSSHRPTIGHVVPYCWACPTGSGRPLAGGVAGEPVGWLAGRRPAGWLPACLPACMPACPLGWLPAGWLAGSRSDGLAGLLAGWCVPILLSQGVSALPGLSTPCLAHRLGTGACHLPTRSRFEIWCRVLALRLCKQR